jgi:SsrA-binding protein
MPTSTIATNAQGRRDYELFDSIEAGICLTGTEVKALREGRCTLKDSFAVFEKGEIYVLNMHIAPYSRGNIHNHDPIRRRKLLLHKNEIMKLYGRLTLKGLTLIPIKMYWKHGLVKCQVALAKSKKSHDKRQTIMKRMAQREIDRARKR